MAANERSLDTHAAAQGEKIVAAAADRYGRFEFV